MIVLGLHGGCTINQHEPSAALIVDGKVEALCEEERYLRIKSCYGYLPLKAIQACLKITNIKPEEIDLVVTPGSTYDFFDKRISHFLRHSFGINPRIERVHHQDAHNAAAFYASGYDKALCISLDATGDGSCGFVSIGDKKNGFTVLEKLPTINSLGLFYTMMTHYLGFSDGDEYKVMGLAPYGKPEVDLSNILKQTSSGWNFDWSFIRNDPSCKSPFEPLYSEKLIAHLGTRNRHDGEALSSYYENVASSTQKQLETCLLKFVTYWHEQQPTLTNLCLSGGVAMNCVANGKIKAAKLLESIFVPPVTSDRGLSLGCAYLGVALLGDTPQKLSSAYLGSSYSLDSIKNELDSNGINYKTLDDPSEMAASLPQDNKIIGWHQGRSEAGARALGNRSILASASGREMRDKVNQKIKFREKFRPFAPSVLLEDSSIYFKSDIPSPWMCFTTEAKIEKANEIPAVLHVDNTARVQTVSELDNPAYYNLIKNYKKHTGTGLILNTSYNLKGQPIVETPRDAIMTFFGCGLDALILGDFLVTK